MSKVDHRPNLLNHCFIGFVFFFSLAALGVPSELKKERGFKRTTRAYPRVVRLFANNDRESSHPCTGVAFKNGCVLTDAHCFDDIKGVIPLAEKKIFVLQEGRLFEVLKEKTRIPKEYAKGPYFDVAVAKVRDHEELKGYHTDILADELPDLAAAMEDSENKNEAEPLRKITLLDKNALHATVVGYGSEGEASNFPESGQLKDFALAAQGPVLMLGTVAQIVGLDRENMDQHFISLADPAYIVAGDSGAPLFHGGKTGAIKLLGLAKSQSVVPGDGLKNLAQITGRPNPIFNTHTSIPRHHKWISEQFKDLDCWEK